jgi:hypothetical protein
MYMNKKPCCGMTGDPMMYQTPMMPQGGMGGMADCGCGCEGGCGCPCPCEPIVEPCIEKCVQREFCHEVRHICPIHTKVINNHIYRHVYDPQYSCSEENVVCNIDQGSCCNFQ